MLSKIVYRLSDGLVLSIIQAANLNAITPVYDTSTSACVVINVPTAVSLVSGEWFFSNGLLVENLYGSLQVSVNTTNVPADGTSMATFTISKLNMSGSPATSSSDNDSLTISATRGRLSSINPSLINGQTTFTLTSVTETVSAIVTVSSANLGSYPTIIQFTP